MNTTEKLSYVEKYLITYFDEMLIEDIRKIVNKQLHFTFPYILLVSTGIDFLGGLTEGFLNNSRERSCNFIEAWMGKINILYADKKISEVIYKSVRCGSSHQAMYKKGVESSSRLYPPNKHLNHMVSFKGRDRIFIHALQFANDFIDAQKLYRVQFIKANPDSVYDNLIDMIRKDPIEGFDELIEDLKQKGLTFDAQEAARTNPEVKSFDPETGRIVYSNDDILTTPFGDSSSVEATTTAMPDDDIVPIPTAAPEEDDLKKTE